MDEPAWIIDTAPPPPPPPPPPLSPAMLRSRQRAMPRGVGRVTVLVALASVLGLLLGGRASAEDGRTAATAALAAGDPARAVGLDEAVAGRGGFLMLLAPGAASAAEADAQHARIDWARQLAARGDVDSAIAVLALVQQPSLLSQASLARAQILVAAAAAAIRSGNADLALLRLDQAARTGPPPTLAAAIASTRAADEVSAAAELVAAGRAPDALALLDDAAAHGAGTAAAAAYPATLLAAARAEAAALDFGEAAASLQRLATSFAGSPQARTARALLRAPQTVSGTLVDDGGHGVGGRVRLSTHFTQLSGGYVTSGPFYYGTSDGNGDFSIGGVPVGGPYVLEYLRDSGWMTLVDPRTDLPANPVTVAALTPEDLTFIVLPA